MSDSMTRKESHQLDSLPEPLVSTLPPMDRKKKGLKFWLIFMSLCFSLFLSALELCAVGTALPTIVSDLHGNDFAWVGSAYALASTAILPMSGGVAELFGRKISMLSALVIFALGSALCGSAQSMEWLIAARTVQGLGGGGILSISSIVVSDLVPLQERGAYNGLIGLTWALATATGPVIGGSLASAGQWRWLFYLNVPVCAIAFAMVMFFLTLPTPPGTFREKLSRLDWIGNLIIVSSTTSTVIGLTWGGVTFAWSSARVVVPLVLGLCGMVFFVYYEARFATHPIVPFEILSNRSSFSGYIQTFIVPLVVLSVAYYLPVYYQACKHDSAIRSGVSLLGFTVALGPSVVVGGVSVTIKKVYRPQMWFAWMLFIVGMGAFSITRTDSPTAQGIGLPSLMGIAAGILYATTYFPVLSPLPVTENAHALAFFSFCRSFAGTWGVSIGASILQNELRKRLPAEFLASLSAAGGSANVEIAYAVIPQIEGLPEPLRQQVRVAFGESVAVIWQVMTGILGIGVLASAFMPSLPLQNVLDEKWALKHNGKDGESQIEMTRTPEV